jgi:ABC-type Fe3+-citrate transport system substrate-binding protein
MKKLFILIFALISLNTFAQKVEKDLKYYYYYVNQDKDFMAYLKAKKEFEIKKYDFKLPNSKEAVKEIETQQDKILKTQKTYAEFLTRYGMKNAGEYAELWFNQMTSLKTFIKKNPEFYRLSAKERQNIIDKWYYTEVAAN